MSIKVTVEPKEGLEMVALSEVSTIHFDSSHGDDIKDGKSVWVIRYAQRQSGYDGFWCTNGTGTLRWFYATATVHPRPDIDALLAAQMPEEAPVAVRVELADVKDMQFYIVDGFFSQATRLLLGELNKVFVRSVHFVDPKGNLVAFIEAGNEFDHTIEAADVKMTARRVYKP